MLSSQSQRSLCVVSFFVDLKPDLKKLVFQNSKNDIIYHISILPGLPGSSVPNMVLNCGNYFSSSF